MAAVSKRLRAGKVVGYRVRFTDPTGKERSQSFPLGQKDAANQFATKVEREKTTGTFIDVNAGKRTFASYAEEWQKNRVRPRDTSKAIAASYLKNHIVPTFGAKELIAIRPSHVREWMAVLDAKLAPNSVKGVFATFSQIIRAAGRDRLIPATQVEDLLAERRNLPEVYAKRVKPLAPETIVALVNAIDPAAIAILTIGTGMRRSEITGLAPDKVNWFAKTITVDRQLSRDGTTLVPVKNARRCPSRTIPVSDEVLQVLSAYIKGHPFVKVHDAVDGRDTTVIFSVDGKPITLGTWASRIWTPEITKLVGDTHHACRHYYASLLIRYGIDVKTVAEHLGDTVEVTLKTYAHLWDDNQDRTRAAVAAGMAEIFDIDQEREAQ